jgi:hypothetical protein
MRELRVRNIIEVVCKRAKSLKPEIDKSHSIQQDAWRQIQTIEKVILGKLK